MLRTWYAVAAIAGLSLSGCSDSDSDNTDTTPMAEATKTLTMSFSGLEELGADFVYEGWLSDGVNAPVTAGRFTIDNVGGLSTTTFEIPVSVAESAKTYILTIEPVVIPIQAHQQSMF